MSESLRQPAPGPGDVGTDGKRLEPLPGEPGIPSVTQRARSSWSGKGLLALGLVAGGLVLALGAAIFSWSRGGGGEDDSTKSDPAASRPATALSEPRRLEMAMGPSGADRTGSPGTADPVIPALLPRADEAVEPIGVRRTGTPQGGTRSGAPQDIAPEDAPVLVVSSRPVPMAPAAVPSVGGPTAGVPRGAPAGAPGAVTGGVSDPSDPLAATTRNLQQYQGQLQGLLDSLTRSAALATGAGGPPSTDSSATPSGALLSSGPPGGPSAGGPQAGAPGANLFGGQLMASVTPRVVAGTLGDRSLTLPKGTAFTCALKTRVISATSGLVGCQVQRHVYSDDGRVLLIERGSHLDGEYRITSVRPGAVRIPVLWTRLRTPLGVVVDIASPGTGPLGEAGIDGHVDNRWGERIGAALLLSLIDDSVKLVIQNQTADRDASTIVLPSTTASTSKLAEKVLDSTINIPPLIYQNQGGIVGIYVARDVDFSSVYALQPSER